MAVSRKTVRILAYGAIYVFWGGSFLAIRDMVAVTPPFFSAAIRFFFAGVALYCFSRWHGSARVSGRAVLHSLPTGYTLDEKMHVIAHHRVMHEPKSKPITSSPHRPRQR